MQFQDDLAAGIVLVRPALRSPNYAAGSAGWNVGVDGSAEFNNVVVRGTVVAKNAAGATATLTPDAPSGISDATAPGLQLSMPTGDTTPAGFTEFDDTFSRGLYIRTSSPLDIASSGEGVDYASIRMEGRFHGSDPKITIAAGDAANAPNGGVWVNGTFFDASGGIQAYGGQMNTYTPSVGNDGTAAYSIRRGWWYRFGPMIYVNVFLSVSTAGSGTGIVTVTMPTAVDRTNRQALTVHAETIGVNGTGSGTIRGGECVFFTGGSGATADRIRVDDSDGDGEGNVLGADLKVNGLITIQGWYLEQQ